jgi:acetolactate synthase regulatory subunit
MDLYRIRIEVADDPGHLGRVLVALGRLGINVVEIDCHNVDGTVRVDDLLVHLTRPFDIPAIARAVEHASCPLIDVRPLSVHDLQDPVVRGMRLIAHVAAADVVSGDLIAWCAGELVRSDLACVIDEQIASAASIAGQALAGNVAVHGREWVKRLPSGDPPWTLAVPFEPNGRRAAVVVHRETSRFTRTETARLLALVDAASHSTMVAHHTRADPSTLRM